MSNRSCKRNKRAMYYALYDDKIPILDANGDETFEYTNGYKTPVPFKASLSTGSSSSEEGYAGVEGFYNREISTTDMTLPIDETTLIWVDKEPTYKDDGTVDDKSANYKVNAPPRDGIRQLVISVEHNE